jgi:anaerobic ribonucleoside-triphosphate reductase
MVIKRDGRQVSFDKKKIESAVLKAFKAVDGKLMNMQKEKLKISQIISITLKKRKTCLLKKFKILWKKV